MNSKSLFKWSIFGLIGLIGLILTSLAWASPKRIDHNAQITDTAAKRIYLKPGLMTLLKLPCKITESSLGDPDSFKLSFSKKNQKRVALKAIKKGTYATNLILLCKERAYVFDLIAQNKIHQDVVKLQRTCGKKHCFLNAMRVDERPVGHPVRLKTKMWCGCKKQLIETSHKSAPGPDKAGKNLIESVQSIF